MIKTLIIDDEQHAIDAIVDHLKAYQDYSICGTAESVEKATQLTKILKPDLVFLDIVLGTKTGFDYLNAFLPKIDFNIIFTTAYDNYAVKAFEYSALHYLLKPIDPDKFKQALLRVDNTLEIQKYIERLQALEHNMDDSKNYKIIYISTTEKNYRINTKNILFLNSDSNYTHFHLIDGTRITVSKTLKYYSKILEDSHFFKAHKSYLVNLEQVKAYDKKISKIIMNDETKINLAVRRQKEFTQYFQSK